MITRRMFHARLLATLSSVALPWAAGAEAPIDRDQDALWLNRLSFGATPESRAEIGALGREAWFERQLTLPVSDPGLDARLAAARLRIVYEAGGDGEATWDAVDELRAFLPPTTDPKDLVHLVEWDPARGVEFSERIRPAQEVIAASLIRAVHAEAQLREMMAQFWHDHFSVNSMKDEYTAALFASHDALMRANAFGNFRVLLGEVAQSPAMLYYLNNADSFASPANENYARELLELHTLGAANYLNDRYSDWREVPGSEAGLAHGYLDLDVYEVARAFTGWSVGDGRWNAEGEQAPRTGRFHYVARWHDPYQKRVLGREFSPNRAPMEDGNEVLDILAAHPGTARFLCEKIARRFLADEPDPALVARMAETFLAATAAPDQIAQVLRVLVLSDAIIAPPAKIRRPFEFLVAVYRASGAEVVSTENGFQWPLMQAGWRQHEFGPPTGHPDRIGAWTGASSLNRLVDLAINSLTDWFDGGRVDLSVPASSEEQLVDFLTRPAERLVQGKGREIAHVLAEAHGHDPSTPASGIPAAERQDMALAAIAFAALTPEFLLR